MDKDLEQLRKEVEAERKALYLEKYGFLNEEFKDEEVIEFLKRKRK